MSYRLPRDVEPVHCWPAPGSWSFVRSSDETDGPTARVCCPNCNTPASLSNHRINDSGKVTPSVVCPTAHCNWHVVVVLDGWAQALTENKC